MKKYPLLLFGIVSTLFLSSCSLKSPFSRGTSEETTAPVETKSRVYMDEVHGTLISFDGNLLTLQKDENTFYTFDVSEATLECDGGMITGDAISVIFEGKLTDNSTDTSAVRAIKVADELHKSGELEEKSGYVEVLNLTPNTITVRSKKGNTATYLITGVEQYYEDGITPGLWVYVHFKGAIEKSTSDPKVLDASHIKVLSISNIDPIKVQKELFSVSPSITPSANEATDQTNIVDTFRATIQDINLGMLTVLPEGSKQPISINLSDIPVYLKGGAAPGSSITVKHSGTFDGKTTKGIKVLGIIGDDPDTLNNHTISSTITGTVVGATLNTVTIQTNDGATITCDTQNASDLSTKELAIGSVICITFNPAESRESNIYHCITIKDAA